MIQKKCHKLGMVVEDLQDDNAFQIVCVHVLVGELVSLDVIDGTSGELDWLAWLDGLGVWAQSVDSHHVLVSLKNFAEGDVFFVQESGSSECEEELGSVCVFASVGHADDSSGCVAHDEVLVVECWSVDAGASTSVLVEDISAVEKHVLDCTVAVCVLVADFLQLWSLESLAESLEVEHGDWCGVSEHSDGDVTDEVLSLSVVVLDLESEHDLSGHCEVGVGRGQGQDGRHACGEQKHCGTVV